MKTAVAAGGGLAVSASLGLNFGVSNHNTYLLGALRLLHLELLQRDWLATETTDYHRHFAYLAAALWQIGENGWPFALVNLLFTTAAAVTVYWIMRIDPGTPRPLPAFLVVMSLAAVTSTYSLGESYLFSGILQPSTLGTTGMLAAFYLFIRGRFLLSGIAIGAGGFFHTNFLVLGGPLFLLAHIFSPGPGLPARLVRQLLPAALLALPAAPLLLSAAGGEAGRGLEVLFEIRSPHHYDPSFFRLEFIGFAGWLILLGVTVPRGDLAGQRERPGRRRGGLVLSLAALLFVVGVLSTAFQLPAATQLYVWRLAPFLVLFAQMHLARALLRLLSGLPYDGLLHRTILRSACLALGVGLLLLYYRRYSPAEDFVPVAGVLVTAALLFYAVRGLGNRARAGAPRRRAAGLQGLLVVALPAAAFALATVPLLADLGERSSLLLARPEAERSLYAWAGTTPTDSLFLIPPDMDDFRLQARRAVVVDWKSTPLLPGELDQWYSRLSEVSGGRPPRSAAESARQYAGMSAGRFRQLADRFAVDYVLVRRTPAADLPESWPIAFANERFEVRRRPPDTG